MGLSAPSLLELAVCVVDRPQELVKVRRLLDRPNPIERRPQEVEVTTRKETDGNNSF